MKTTYYTIRRFLLPVLILLVIAPAVYMKQHFSQQMDVIHAGAIEQALTLGRLLNITNALVDEKANISMQLLKNRTLVLGDPSVSGFFNVDGKSLPSLMFGETQLTNNFNLVDSVSDLAGGTATLFVKSGDDFIRVTTNVLLANGERAVGTQLNKNGKAIVALRAGQEFHGVVDILGEPYITRYAPMFNENSDVMGAYYVGYKADMNVLRNVVQNASYLKSGFTILIDSTNKTRFLSSNIEKKQAEQLIHEQPKSWDFIRYVVPNWGFTIIVAYPKEEARAIGLASSLVAIIAASVVSFLLIAVILWQMRRLIFDPIGADPTYAIDVVNRIALGNLEDDGFKAKSGTLMANVINMRQKLSEMVATLRMNAERMSLSASVFNHAHDGIFIADTAMRIIEVNPSFITITGFSAEEVIGKTPSMLNSDCQDEQFYAEMWATLNHTGVWKGEIWNRRKNGEIYPEYLTITSVNDVNGGLVNYVVTFTDITLRKAAEERIQELAFYDPLTNLPNRRLLLDRLGQAMASSVRNNRGGALLFLDLDHFKSINDTLGHDVGDFLLRQVAERLTSCVREGDTVARLGGDEFVVLLEDLSEHLLEAAAQTEVIGEKIIAALNQPYQLDSHVHQSTTSVGAALFSDHHQSLEDLLKHADIAMYQSKKLGRNRLSFFDPNMQEAINARVNMENELRKALDEQQFQLHYQAQVDDAGHVLGAEALIRWNHPERGIIAHFNFIPLAEDTGLILPIGQWVLDTACAQIKAWEQSPATRDLTLSINVSAKQFLQLDFVKRVQESLQRHNITPSRLKFELTESMLLDNIEHTIAIMNALRVVGIRFSLDDFGTGYSSLQYLKKLPLNQLKIDQSFVRDIATDSSDKAIIITIITMAKSMELEVIAEGVETEAQKKLLANYGCKHYQGYLFGRPVPIEMFEAALK
jgi:diguanylate cyclase (GGDEF)-like protein/PAS domain S-box-containing protein